MARALTPQDGYAIMTALVRQATGQSNISVVDMNTFISAGETVMASGKETVFDALSLVIGRTLVASRSYRGKLRIMNALNTGTYSHRMRKISFYSKDPLPSGWYNTNLYTNEAPGFTNGQNPDGNGDAQSTKSQWEQNPAIPLEMNFAGSTTWQYCLTMYEDQINQAFRDPVELAEFVAGMIQEHRNDIESAREAFNRMILNNRILSTYTYEVGAGWMSGSCINMTTAYNTFYGTNYTSEQLRSTYQKSFFEYLTSVIKEQLDLMEERTAQKHLPMTKTVNGVSYSILRHTPKDRIHFYLFRPLIRRAESIVMPEIFRPEYLNISQYEPVDYWQSNYSDAVRPQIKGRCAYYNKLDGTQTTSGDITLDYVIGLITDQDGLMSDLQIESARTTGLEARKGYRNTWITFAKNGIDDPTESRVLLYMDDSSVTPAEPAAEGGEA